MADRVVTLALAWLLLLALLGGSVHVAVPVAVRLWREQTTAVAAQVRALAAMPLLPEPCLRDLLRRSSGRHRKRRLSNWLRWAVAS